jgi:hypothetical protein
VTLISQPQVMRGNSLPQKFDAWIFAVPLEATSLTW